MVASRWFVRLVGGTWPLLKKGLEAGEPLQQCQRGKIFSIGRLGTDTNTAGGNDGDSLRGAVVLCP